MRIQSFAIVALLLFCSKVATAQLSGVLPHVVVYKAKAKYRKLVPVQLSPDKKSIVSYPGPGDVKTGSGFPLPVSLRGSYWLDKIGVDTNTAYIKFTYRRYSKLKEVPASEELYKMIVVKSPMTELYDCGVRNDDNNSVKRLNALIDKKQLKKKCRQIK